MLKMRALGRTKLQLSELGFGAAPIGNLYREISDESAAAAVDAAWDVGIRYFDTAPHYGLGLSERRLGAALAARPRSEYVLSTKVGRLLVDNPHPTGSDLQTNLFDVPDLLTRRRDYTRDGVLRSIEASLVRLGLDRIDIALVHDPDDVVDLVVGETIPALVRLREEGVIGAVGVGMNQWQAPLRIVRESDLDVVMPAGRWTLVDRTASQLMDECVRRTVGVLAAAPYNSGLLAQDWPEDGAYFDYGPASPEILGRARDLARTAQALGWTLPALAMQFPLQHPATTSVVTGMRTAAQVRSTAERINATVPQQVWDELER
ncbi:D-threo-aldose 1-dehydrogenase [Nakamurella sp. UYEF19]|uniref:aldo/keto reductase n=1 Tax=Nakamurella sp. UYEF19 TaxID=1756392 RepID=UPI00339704E6